MCILCGSGRSVIVHRTVIRVPIWYRTLAVRENAADTVKSTGWVLTLQQK